jgi:ATP-dependent Lhr-like helicase
MQQAVVSRLGWRSLRPVQEASIAPLLAGHDAIVLAPTAGGKTESAMLPLLDRLLAGAMTGQPAILYLCPLKALINNLLPRLQSLAQLAGRQAFAWHGEVSATERKGFLQDPQAVLLTTPESLQVILSRSWLDVAGLFGGLQTIVIDEVHAFAGSSRGDQLIALMHQLDALCGRAVQRVGLSATVGNPQHLLAWLGGGRGRPLSLIDPDKEGAQKSKRMLEVHPVGSDSADCAALLSKLMRSSAKSLLFVDSRRQAEEIRGQLARLGGLEALAHHSSLSQEMRQESEAAFKGSTQGKRLPQAIVCTSTLELGLDVGDVDKVFQLGAPSTVSAFLQRFGRAGRRHGSVAHMVFVTDQEESFLRALALIRLALARQVEPVLPDSRAFCVLVQQILLQVLKHGAIAPDKLWTALGSPPCFAGITAEERTRLLAHMLEGEWLLSGQGRLRLGDRTEKAYGRSHFLELLSVFSGGASVAVKTVDGRSVGTLDATVALRLWSERSSFILGGGSWLPKGWDERSKTLTVTGSVGGETVRWSGSKGEVSLAISRELRALLTSDGSLPFLGPKAQARLDELRSQSRQLDPERPMVWETGKLESRKTVIELWAGQRVHRTLADAWSGLLGCTASCDSRRITLATPRATWESLLVQMLSGDAEPSLRAGLRVAQEAAGPQAAEVKFCELLPEDMRREVLWKQHYDVPAAATVLRELEERVVVEHVEGDREHVAT